MTSLSIFSPRRLARLIASDWTNTRRDPTLLFVALFAAVPALLIWYFRAGIDRLGADMFGLAALSDWIVPIVLTLPPLMLGWVIGFLFLEERDDGPLAAISMENGPSGRSVRSASARPPRRNAPSARLISTDRPSSKCSVRVRVISACPGL